MVDEQFGIYTKQIVEQFLIVAVGGFSQGAAGNVAHGEKTVFLQLFCVPAPHPPEIRQGAVRPEHAPVGSLVKLRNPHAVLVGFDVLGSDIQSDLAEVEVGADACGSRDAGGLEHIPDHFHGQIPGGQAVGIQIVGYIHEHLIDGVDVDILGRNVFQVNVVDAGAEFHVVGHPGRRDEIRERQGRVCLQRGLAA